MAKSGVRERERKLLALLSIVAITLTASGCLDSGPAGTAICVLVDVSGTYADEKEEVVRILKREVLPSLAPGDTLITIRIDSESYDQENVATLVTLDARPSQANAQKLALSKQLDAFAKERERSRYTDIPGAMMLGAEYLRETGSRTQVMLVFSDLREELPDGVRRELRKDEFRNVQLVAMNVKRLGSDRADPERYRRRLEQWQSRFEEAGGGAWQVVMDATKLAGVLDGLRS